MKTRSVQTLGLEIAAMIAGSAALSPAAAFAQPGAAPAPAAAARARLQVAF